MDAILMPGGMHPWMDPHTETRLWPHESSRIYKTFDRIFDCRGHGWANLQSTHINLPFGDDEEFGRLHAAMRLVLPIIPALCASSPIADGRPTGLMDTRLEFYRKNALRVPSVTARVIPEPVFSRADYEGKLLGVIYNDLAPLDPDGVVRFEWVNARGCIARFDRGAIEIRLLDSAECPLAEVALTTAITSVLKALAGERFQSYEQQRLWPVEPLAAIFLDTIRHADQAAIHDEAYLRALGYDDAVPCPAGQLWSHLVETTFPHGPAHQPMREAVDVVLEEGCLARRIIGRLQDDSRKESLRDVYEELCQCLAEGRLFRSEG
jgi:gamma-glutamyl:cysteine ligase YbdK (ATP-grasp superfamily)